MKHWLMKSEPESYSIDDLKRDGTTWWEGVRNYQARNFMMKDMNVGDFILFYHSNAEPPGIAGLAIVSKPAEPDKSANDKKPIWFCVEVKFKEKFKKFVALEEIKSEKYLNDMLVVKKGQRLSVQPVEKKHFDKIIEMAKR